MRQAAAVYDRIARATQSPRDLESGLLLRAAMRLQMVRDDWEAGKSELENALSYNGKLWTVLMAAEREDNPLPREIRANVMRLAGFVPTRTLAVRIAPAPQKLGAMIDINGGLAAGLRGDGGLTIPRE